MPKRKTPIAKLSSWIPFPAMTLLVIALFLIREQFPFSNFPMYSNISEEADVILVTDGRDQPLAMKPLFKTSSGTTKKMWRRELAALTSKDGRDSDHATKAERTAAGEAVMRVLESRLIAKALPVGTEKIRLQVRTFRAGYAPEDGPAPEVLAELIVAPATR